MQSLIVAVVLVCTLFGVPIFKIPPGEHPIDISPDPIPVKPETAVCCPVLEYRVVGFPVVRGGLGTEITVLESGLGFLRGPVTLTLAPDCEVVAGLDSVSRREFVVWYHQQQPSSVRVYYETDKNNLISYAAFYTSK